MTTWVTLLKLYQRLDRLRITLSLVNPGMDEIPRARNTDYMRRRRVEDRALQLEKDIDREIRLMTSAALDKEREKRCGSVQSSAV